MTETKHSSEWTRLEWAKVIVGLIFLKDARKAVGLAIDAWIDTPEPRVEAPTVDPSWESKPEGTSAP